MTKVITLKKNEDKRITSGHLWAFSNEIQEIKGEPQAGDIVELRNHAGIFLGIGFYNPHSLIAVRVLSREEEEINFDFFKKRIESSLALRKRLYPNAETFRLVHGESDFLPGLIIDKYNEYISLQTFSYGMDRRLTLICDVLESILHPEGIVERNETPIRSLEGLEQKKGIVRGSVQQTIISEYGIKFNVDLLEGQKTGFFLDQRENRKAFRRYVKGMNVLDCFCNDGGFSLHATHGEASEITGVDISDSSIQHSTENARLNNFNARFVTSDVFEFLKSASEKNQKFDVINLDPPSFAKSKKTVHKAIRGYREIHSGAIALLKPDGILSTASCSHHITEETFLDIINDCARKAGRNICLLEWRGASPDHPVLPAMPETRYLKFGVFRVE